MRSTNKDDLPLRLTIAADPGGRFRYVILRNDGMIDRRSAATFATEDAARAAGGPVLRRRHLAARLNTPHEEWA
jgi:hypothetical protein